MRILLIGRGRLGRLIEELALASGHSVACVSGREDAARLSTEPQADVAIDVSHPKMLPAVLAYAARTKTPLCCGVTGYSESQMNDLTELSTTVPVLYSANFSLGIAVFRRVLAEISPLLADDFDVEMVEVHHNQKADAPSGTAKLLADAIDPGGKLERVYGRSGMCGKRPKKEMGIFSMRGGTVSGTHTVSFFGEDETFTLTHSASSRRIFAKGALKAAEALARRGRDGNAGGPGGTGSEGCPGGAGSADGTGSANLAGGPGDTGSEGCPGGTDNANLAGSADGTDSADLAGSADGADSADLAGSTGGPDNGRNSNMGLLTLEDILFAQSE